jgi:hypothetical protein
MKNDDTDDLPIVNTRMTDKTLYSTILDMATKGNPPAIEKWKTFFEFVQNKEKLYPPFGVSIKNKKDPMVMIREPNMPEKN